MPEQPNHKNHKVCHMTSVHSSDDTRIFHKMCVSLAKAGYETHLVAPGESFSADGVSVNGVGPRPASRLKRMFSFAGTVYKKALAIDADIYHFHDPELIPYGLKLKRSGKIVIYDSHEDYTQTIRESTWIPAPLRGIIARIYSVRERQACVRLDAVVGVVPQLIQRFEKHGALNTVMITNYPVADKSIPLPPRNRNRKLCFAGGVVPKWLHENIISTLSACDARYDLAGPAADAYLQKLQSLDGWGRVNYYGHLPHKEVPSFLRGCAAGLAVHDYIGSLFDRMGVVGVTKLFEYMLNGLPVICTDFSVWKDVVESDNCGLCVNPNDTQAIENAIRYLLDHPDEADVMGQNGRKAVLEKYNWDTQAAVLIELYETLLSRKS